MTERDGHSELILDGQRYKLVGNLAVSNLATFQQKIVIGDYSKDSNPLLSSWVISDLTGGSGVFELNEGSDVNRYHGGTLYTRFPGALTAPPVARSNHVGDVEGTGDKRVYGQVWNSADSRYEFVWSAGTTVYRGIPDATLDHQFIDGFAVTTYGTALSSAAANQKGVAFQGTHTEERFFIPRVSGWSVLNGNDTTLTNNASPDFQSFEVWDNKLIGLDRDGDIYYSLDGTTWTQYDTLYSLPRGRRVRKIINFFDRRDEPCLFIITDQDIWQFDPDGPEIFRIDFGFPAHPYHGLAAAVWSGQLYVSVGMGVFRYTGGAWMGVGLDRDDGLPLRQQGYIVDLVPGYNALYALVQSTNLDPDYGGASSIHEFSGTGWHCIWQDTNATPSDTTATTVTSMTISNSLDRYTLLWGTAGTDDHVYTMPLSLTWANPRAAMGTGAAFGQDAYYYLDTGEFDASMEGYTKIANAFQVTIEEPVAIDLAMRDTLSVYYRVDGGAWTLLGSTVATPGRYTFPFGAVITGGGATDTEGVSFERIQFRYTLTGGGGSNNSPVIRHGVFSFLKIVEGSYAWTGTIDCMGKYDGRTPQEMQDELDALVSSDRFVPMIYGGTTYRVFVSQVGGETSGGDDGRGMRRLSVVEVPSDLA